MGGRRITEPYHCDWCGERFKPHSRKSRFCSRTCQAKGLMAVRDTSGPNNPHYKGGLSESQGRTIIVCRDGSWALYSRAVMEAHVGRPLRSDEIVHHVNGNPADDRIENLRLTTRSEHIAIHRDELLAAQGRRRREPQPCFHCGQPFVRGKATQRYCSTDCGYAAQRKVAA